MSELYLDIMNSRDIFSTDKADDNIKPDTLKKLKF